MTPYDARPQSCVVNARKVLPTSCSKLVGMYLICNSLLCFAQTRPNERNKQESLEAFLKDFLKISASGYGQAAPYRFSFIDLNDDGKKEVMVYLMDTAWCGSGGCTTLVLAPKNLSYTIVSKISLTRPPIRVLGTKSNGWHDLSAVVGGGGIERAHDVRLSFDGKTYPSNPTVSPARPVTGAIDGRIVLAK